MLSETRMVVSAVFSKPPWLDILHARIPKGLGGHFDLPAPFTDMVMRYSGDEKLARNFLHWIHSKPVFAEWFTSQRATPTAPPGIGRRTRCGKPIGSYDHFATDHRSGGGQVMLARPIARPLEC
jgi:hypothetical protein